MGIYGTDNNIYGIKIYNDNRDNDTIITLFEIQSEEIISNEQKGEARIFYEKLDNKQNVFFKIYTECISTYREGTFMMWKPLSLSDFLEYFCV